MPSWVTSWLLGPIVMPSLWLIYTQLWLTILDRDLIWGLSDSGNEVAHYLVFYPFWYLERKKFKTDQRCHINSTNHHQDIARQSCTQTITVVSGDTCSAIEGETGLNPSINSGCTNLQIGQVLCVNEGGGLPESPSTAANTDFIIALGDGNWDGGSHCGETVDVEYQGNTIRVTVEDLCPGCHGANGINLSEGAMAALDSNYINDGVISVVWSSA
ncbi:hypothetical protein K438DRAFT_1936406 [Mycena galopus ATCC 62051]|nr:hypothetical protein K438DRAFT_1936406 [Mycena galopus ATCC 62051]